MEDIKAGFYIYQDDPIKIYRSDKYNSFMYEDAYGDSFHCDSPDFVFRYCKKIPEKEYSKLVITKLRGEIVHLYKVIGWI